MSRDTKAEHYRPPRVFPPEPPLLVGQPTMVTVPVEPSTVMRAPSGMREVA
jgi:hypothetical protein